MAAHHEQDVRNLKGVLKKLPITNLAFLVGCIGGAGLLPFLAAGFFSKEAVLGALENAEYHGFGITLSGHVVHWIVIAVETISVLYLFRLYGYLRSDVAQDKHSHSHGHDSEIKETSPAIRIVLGLLIVGAIAFGIVSASPSFGGKGLIWSAITGGAVEPEGPHLDHVLPFLAVNLLLAVLCFMAFSRTKYREAILARLKPLRFGSYGPLSRLFYFDDVYTALITTPLRAAAYLSRLILENIFTGIITVTGWLGQTLSLALRHLQSGKAHQYAIGVLMAAFFLAFYLGGR